MWIRMEICGWKTKVARGYIKVYRSYFTSPCPRYRAITIATKPSLTYGGQALGSKAKI